MASYEKKGYINEHYHYFHLKDSEGQELDFHFHEFDKLVILRSGNVVYSLEHEDYTLEPGKILLVPHHTIHRARIDTSCPYERIIIYFDRMYLRSLLPNVDVMYCFEQAKKTGGYLLQPDAKQNARVEELLQEYEASGEEFGAEGYRDTLMLQLLIWLGRVHTTDSATLTIKADDKIQQTLTYINEHLKEDLSVDLLAERVHLSRSYFMHQFKEETGCTVHATITQKRLLYAARLIRGGMTVTEAAAESGFTDYTGFYRSFQAAFKITPREIKNQ